MVRSRKGIETLVNLINIAYCAMKLLPYQDETFSKYQNESTQEIRFAFSEGIRQEKTIFMQKGQKEHKNVQNVLDKCTKRT